MYRHSNSQAHGNCRNALCYCPDGETGRRSGLKIRRPQGRGGSNPPLGTKFASINRLFARWRADWAEAYRARLLTPDILCCLPRERRNCTFKHMEHRQG